LWCALFTENKNKALQSASAGGQHYSLPVTGGTGGVVSQPGVVQTVGGGVGADPINALQNLTKQPVQPGMTQPCSLMFNCILSLQLSVKYHVCSI